LLLLDLLAKICTFRGLLAKLVLLEVFGLTELVSEVIELFCLFVYLSLLFVNGFLVFFDVQLSFLRLLIELSLA